MTNQDKQEMKKFLDRVKKSLNDFRAETEALSSKLKSELEKLTEPDEPEFKRVPIGESYYTAETTDGLPVVYKREERGRPVDEFSFRARNYFHTQERAEEVAAKMKFLLKVERLHDIYCPDYVPDWKGDAPKHYVYYSNVDNAFGTDWVAVLDSVSRTYFPSEEIAQKVCDILNKELKKE